MIHVHQWDANDSLLRTLITVKHFTGKGQEQLTLHVLALL